MQREIRVTMVPLHIERRGIRPEKPKNWLEHFRKWGVINVLVTMLYGGTDAMKN